jgi:hypothetical protein
MSCGAACQFIMSSKAYFVSTHKINHKSHVGLEHCSVYLGTIDASVYGICMLPYRQEDGTPLPL